MMVMVVGCAYVVLTERLAHEWVPVDVAALVDEATEWQLHLAEKIVRDELIVPNDEVQHCLGIRYGSVGWLVGWLVSRVAHTRSVNNDNDIQNELLVPLRRAGLSFDLGAHSLHAELAHAKRIRHLLALA